MSHDELAPQGQGEITAADWGTVSLDDKYYPVRGQVGVTDLGVFPPKVVIGDHTKNSSDVLSVFVISDLTGGGQIDEMNEGTDQNRFWDGVFEWRYPSMIGAAPQTVKTRPDGVNTATLMRPLGDIGTRFYGAWGLTVYAWDNSTRSWGAAQSETLNAAPVNKPVPYDGYVYVPMGNGTRGYQRIKESSSGTLDTFENGPAGDDKIAAQAFVTWADRLIALETNGQISFTVNGTSWTKQQYTQQRKVRVSREKRPINLLAFFNRAGEPTVHIVTDREVLAYDPETPKVWPTPFQFPPHPDVGLGSAVWRPGEDLFVSAGTEIHRWTSANLRIPSAGLNRNHGLPAALRGRVVDLCPEQSYLFALLQGNTTATGQPTWIEDSPLDDMPYFPDGTAYSAMYAQTGTGWGCVWRSDEPTTQATWAMVSAVDGYNLWWGVDNYAYTQRLKREYLNPMEGWRAGEDYFERYSWFETGWFDAAMEGFPKLAVRGIINAEHASAGDIIKVSYKISPTDEWTELGQATRVGETSIPFNYDETGFPEGQLFNRIKFFFEFYTSGEQMSPFMDSFALQFQKLPNDIRAYQFTVPIPSEEWGGRSGDEIDHELRALKTAGRMFRGVIGDMTYEHPLRLRIAGITGDNAPGRDYTGLRVVNVIDLSDPRDFDYYHELQEALESGTLP